MRMFSREAWSYAVLLIVLLALAALAVWHAINFMDQHNVPTDVFNVVTILLWTITLGFMLIAGAFGLWAIHFSTEAETQRRIGRLVDAMDYLPDGICAVDRRGHITGSNPAIRQMVGSSLDKREALDRVFPCLTKDDLRLLLRSPQPSEVERRITVDKTAKAYRFRSQPSEGLMLVLISDVTTTDAQRARNRQIMRLQLIGQLARGVAHDFNTMLCGIAGNAALLSRVQNDPDQLHNSIAEIQKGSERGIALAAHLMELAQPTVAGASTSQLEDHVDMAAQMLRDGLPSEWQVAVRVNGPFPSVALTGIQIEQAILNLGMLTADANRTPGTLTVMACHPDHENKLLNVDASFAAVLIISTAAEPSECMEETHVMRSPTESGAIESVIRSIIDEAGGSIACLIGPKSVPIYRLSLPCAAVSAHSQESDLLPDELSSYLANWTILLAGNSRELAPLLNRSRQLRITANSVETITTALARIESDDNLDAMVLYEHILGKEAHGLLKAIVKLHPSAGIVVLSDAPGQAGSDLATDVYFESTGASPDRVLMAAVEAKSMAIRREATVRS